MNILKKFTAILTTTCFVFSIVFSQTVYAAIPISNMAIPANLQSPDTLIPFNLGRITDAYYSNSGDIVINIQDLHSHEQTQRNISSILSILDNKFGLSDIYIEGATGTLNTKWLSDITDSNTKQRVLDNLLASGRLSGGELFAVQANKNTILKGLEDKDLYFQNFNKLNEIYNKKLEINNYLSVLTNIFNKKSEQYYSNENKKINKIINNYKEGKIKTNKYIESLLEQSQKTNINLSKYKNIINFAKIISKQKSFNQKVLKEEIKELLKDLKEKLNFDEYKILTEKASNKNLEIEFYFDLLQKANELNLLSDKKYKNTNFFFEYLKQNQSINTVDLANEEKILIQEIRDKFAANQAEKDIYFLQSNLESLSHYLKNKMTAKEYETFSENRNKFKLLWEKYIDIDNLTDITTYFNLVDNFYNNNLERNRIFIKSLLGKNPNKTFNGLRIKNSTINHKDKILKELSNGRKIHVVITGGFHTYGFNKLLEDENINYIVITPNITEETTKADILYENVFNEQYDITNTTFANRPITEVIDILKKGEIREVRPVGSNVEIEYVSGEIISLNRITQQQGDSEVLNTDQAKIIADIILNIQELRKIKRENLRAEQEDLTPVSTDELEKKIIEGFTKTENLNLKIALGEKIRNEVWSRPLTTTGLKNTKWYKTLTKLGWVNLRESLVAIFEQKDFDNIFTEEILGKISDRQESARERFLQEHEYYDEQEDVSVQLNNAVTSVIEAMNAAYKQVFGYFGIHFIAKLAAQIAGAKKHKEYNVNIYKLSKNIDTLLTKAEQHTYQVKFRVYFSLSGMQVDYNTGNDFFTTAPTKTKALNNAIKRAADDILTKYKLDKSQLMRLTIYLIRENLKARGLTTEKTITEVPSLKESKEETNVQTKKTIPSKKTAKFFKMRNPKSGEYKFNIVIPGLNDTSELSAFQTVYARSPRQAIFELVYQLCMATENGQLTGGVFEDLVFSQKNINDIATAISNIYVDSKLNEIIKNVRANSAPVLNDNVRPEQQNRQMKLGENFYRVIIPNFNDRAGLEPYQYVYAVDERKAIEQAVLEIIKAKERKEIRGGYYNYRTVNRENKKDILELLYKEQSAVIQDVTKQEKPLPEAQEKIQTKKETTKLLNTEFNLFKNIILNSIKVLQRLTYSVLFKDNMEYTIVANADDLARVKQAEMLSNSGIKVNLVLVGETSLIQETTSRISTQNGELSFCLTAAPNQNLTVYGYDGNSYGQAINISTVSEQDSLIAMLQHINNNSQKDIKILDLPTNLDQSIVTTDVEEKAKDLFSVVGVGKTVLNLFLDAAKMKKKKTDNMIMKPSLVASNLSSEQIDNFGPEDINRLTAQGVTTIIISANDKVLQDKSQILKNLLQTAHNNGLKVMFNYNFNLKNITTDDLSKWISSFNDRFQLFKENGGIDGFQADLSQSGVLANNSNVLSLLSKLSKIINEQNVGSFLSIKMPSDIYPTEFLILCNNEGIKLVVDYDSPLVSTAISNLKAENMIINISSNKNGFISISQLSNIFENNKVSMLSLDLPILEAIDSSEGFSFNGLSITKFLTSIFETTPEGQKIRGINKGRNFVLNRDLVIDENVLNDLYSMYISDNFNIQQISDMIKTNFKENISKYELKGFIEGLLEATELKNINAADINFDKQEYSNLLMQTLLDYRITSGISFKESDINKDLEQVLVIEKFSTETQPKIDEVYKILNGKFENKVDTVINILSSLNNNPKLTSQEKAMILEGLLLLLLGYAKQDIIDMGNISQEETIANIKAILRAA